MLCRVDQVGIIRFSLTPGAPAKRVSLAGSFSDWAPVRMRKQKNGAYVAVVPMVPGSYEYKFIVDDEWVIDPENGAYALNSYGTMTSVLTVE